MATSGGQGEGGRRTEERLEGAKRVGEDGRGGAGLGTEASGEVRVVVKVREKRPSDDRSSQAGENHLTVSSSPLRTPRDGTIRRRRRESRPDSRMHWRSGRRKRRLSPTAVPMRGGGHVSHAESWDGVGCGGNGAEEGSERNRRRERRARSP